MKPFRFLKLALLISILLQASLSHSVQAQGTVVNRSFYSPALGLTKSYNIYLPEGYAQSTERYPVVYFLRGHEREWNNPTEDGTRNGIVLETIANDVMASGVCGKMILVMPSTASTDNSVAALGVNMLRPDLTTAHGIGTGKFDDYFTHDLLMHIDTTYRTIADRNHRGLDGFSLGGYTAIMLALKHPDLFSSAACYDGTHMWLDLDDPRVNNTPPDDYTWVGGSMFTTAFDSPRNIPYMKTYNAANLIKYADSASVAAIKRVKFHIHAAAVDGNQGNIDRGNHLVSLLAEKGIVNTFDAVPLSADAVHNWHFANEHAKQSLVKHWRTFTDTLTKSELSPKPVQPPPEKVKRKQSFSKPPTTIEYAVQSGAKIVTLKVYDVLGKEVKTLVHERQPVGTYAARLDSTGLSSGTYFYELAYDGAVQTKKMIFVK
jgi:S-formylglutathione hydrolase FrmB